jgi:hypothetical protein
LPEPGRILFEVLGNYSVFPAANAVPFVIVGGLSLVPTRVRFISAVSPLIPLFCDAPERSSPEAVGLASQSWRRSMTRFGVLGATALTLSLAIATPVLAQQAPGSKAGAHAAAGNMGARNMGARMGSGPRMQSNFRGAQGNVGAANFAGRGNAQFAPRPLQVWRPVRLSQRAVTAMAIRVRITATTMPMTRTMPATTTATTTATPMITAISRRGAIRRPSLLAAMHRTARSVTAPTIRRAELISALMA